MRFAPKAWGGSSPRGRGKRHDGSCRRRCSRLIPAWAGKTRRCPARPASTWAHPRVGGENGERCHSQKPPLGSSPRGRGKRSWSARSWIAIGLIPAWAGKTYTALKPTGLIEAHPRVGGENVGDFFDLTAEDGSSPRGRGKRKHPQSTDWKGRLIPAWAGKTG